ncbi:unnamed protein product [Colias eurytheme]|nr:unnamed protein product [Colias eurytheme]
MPLDYTNPYVLKFLIENFNKENERRIAWFNKNKERILNAAVFTDKCKNHRTEDVSRAGLEPCMSSLALHNINSMSNRRRKPIRDGIINTSLKYNPRAKTKMSERVHFMAETEIPNSFMKPIENDVTKILYEAQPDGGRLQYLKQRARKTPDERYYFCETSNNTCGWKVKESLLDYSHSNRRCYYYQDDSFSRSGPHPDPPHYVEPLMSANFKCTS